MNRRSLAKAAPLFAALGDETRLTLVVRLVRGGPQSSSDLATGMPVTRQAVSKHLRTLESAGVARSRRFGRERIWELQSDALEEARRHLDEISSRWDRAIERLRVLVEEE